MASKSEIDELDELQIALAKFAADMKHDPEPNSTESANEADMDEFSEYEEEYSNLSNTMDEIDEFMNTMEQKNDALVAKLQELLHENRETLQAFKAERMAEGNSKSSCENNEEPPPPV